MAYPKWLGELSRKDELLRAHHGLYAAPDGWYKSFRGKKRYICKRVPLADVVAILPHRLEELDGLISKPVSMAVSSLTIEQLAEIYAAHLQRRHETGSPRPITSRTLSEHLDVLARFLAPIRNQLAITAGPPWFTLFARSIGDNAATTRRREIGYLIAFFNWAGPGKHSQNFYKSPVRFGPDLRKPSDHELRTELANYDPTYTPDQFGAALDAVSRSPLLFAAGLLGLNAALLPIDLATIPFASIDLVDGIHTFARGKNQLPRRCVLMPETITAMKRYLDFRAPPAGPDEPFFVSDTGRPLASAGDDRANLLSVAWSKVTGRRLVGLRSTFATAADGAADQAAVDLVMGHTARSVRSKHYVKDFQIDRLRAVIEPVWSRFNARAAQLSAAPAIGASALARQVLTRKVMS